MRKTSICEQGTQFGFDSIMIEADTANRHAEFAKRFEHLPSTIDEALPLYREIVEKHHGAMMTGNVAAVMTLREEAHNLAVRINHGEPGILAGPDAPGCMLERMTTAEAEIIPLWGQCGSFTIDVKDMRVRIEMDGLFGIGSRHCPWMNFSAHAVDWHKPFLSETGYRSFMGLYAELTPGQTPDSFAAEVITHHVAYNLKKGLKPTGPRYR